MSNNGQDKRSLFIREVPWRKYLRRAAARVQCATVGWRRPRFLLIAYYDPRSTRAISDNVSAIKKYSRHRFDVLNLYRILPNAQVQIPPYVNLNRYDGIFVHCTISYNPDVLARLDDLCTGRLADYRGTKVVMKQDEHFRTNAVVDWLDKTGIDLVVTCLTPPNIAKVYPPERFPQTKFFSALTGYVTDEMRSVRHSQRRQRPIDIGYRGSPQSFCFGRLCYEKQLIAAEFVEICRQHNLVADISFSWDDRIGGQEWMAFLARCKGVIGVESGASVFDFTGELETRCKDFLRLHPDANFETIEKNILSPYEGNVYYNQISPRHLEAAAAQTVQILYEGQYSGMFEPWRHYLPLKRDKSNLDEVLRRFRDPSERTRLTRAAFEEIILNDRFHYSAFVRDLDLAIEAVL